MFIINLSILKSEPKRDIMPERHPVKLSECPLSDFLPLLAPAPAGQVATGELSELRLGGRIFLWAAGGSSNLSRQIGKLLYLDPAHDNQRTGRGGRACQRGFGMSIKKSLTSMIFALSLSVGAAEAQVVVSSKIDTEGGVLGNIILSMLKANEIETTDRIQLGATPVVRKAITAGEIDIYPEYTGNGAFFFEKADDPTWKDPKQAYETVKKLDYEANKIVWLAPSSANNTWGIAVRQDVAQENKLKTLSDLGKFIAGGGKIVLAASSEFVNSAAALPAFQSTYGFQLKSDQLITLSGGDTAATIAAAANQTNGVNAAMVYGTDGGIAPSGLVVLEDDKQVQPVYQPAPIIREEVLKDNPKIADVLGPVFQKLDLPTLQDLNGRVQVGGEPAKAVAEDFLKKNGFIK
jgi:osmoprotectant transport system substrate-binding protein